MHAYAKQSSNNRATNWTNGDHGATGGQPSCVCVPNAVRDDANELIRAKAQAASLKHARKEGFGLHLFGAGSARTRGTPCQILQLTMRCCPIQNLLRILLCANLVRNLTCMSQQQPQQATVKKAGRTVVAAKAGAKRQIKISKIKLIPVQALGTVVETQY